MQTSSNSEKTKKLFELLVQGRDTDNKWSWPHREGWREVTGDYQDFYSRWRGSPPYCEPQFPDRFESTYPYKLSLGKSESGEPLLPFCSDSILGDQIVVTESYMHMLHRILYLRSWDKGREKGVVVTGQPGTGKTTFLKFMLVWLITFHQVVVLADAPHLYLFYKGKVYHQPMSSGFVHLPGVAGPQYHPIWALIDLDYEKTRATLITGSAKIWPIQAAYPNPAQWKPWFKRHGATLLGMPAGWTRQELIFGLDLAPGYNDNMSQIKQSLPALTLTGIRRIDVALEVLRTAGRTMDVGSAFEVLVDNAIYEFGSAPRDVYCGVLNLPKARDDHKDALVQLNYSRLQAIVRAFRTDRLLEESSHRVVAVHPQESSDSHDTWRITFKSIMIQKSVEELMKSEEVQNLRDTYHYFCTTPEASILAGWVFEAMAHRLLNGWRGPTPLLMESDLQDPPTFSVNPPQPPNTSLQSLGPPPAGASVVTVNFVGGIGHVTLDKGKYYKAAVTNNPLFDSFTIDYDLDKSTVLISIFQMTISIDHKGSPKGYDIIHKIKERVMELLQNARSSAQVKVEYFLVCPGVEPRYRWTMPVGWNGTAADLRGNVFCIRIPVAVRPT